MRLKLRKHRVWRADSGRVPSRSRSMLAAFGRRSTAAFFVIVMIFTAAQITGYMWMDRQAQKKALQSAELLPNTNSKVSPVTLNPDYKDPRVKKPADIKMENVVPAKEEDTTPRTSPVTEAAKNTAVLSDPVQKYFEEKQASGNKPKTLTDQEIKSKRTAHSYTYRNSDGGETERMYTSPVNFKKDGAWQPIAGTLKDDDSYNKKTGFKSSIMDQFVPNNLRPKRGFRQDDGQLKLGFKPLNDQASAISITDDASAAQLNVQPLGAAAANPALQTAGDGTKYVEYKDAWKNTDLYYEQRGTSLKEYISLKTPETPTEFKFSVDGATLKFGKSEDGSANGTVVATLKNGTQVVMPALTVSSMKNGPISDPKISYKLQGNTVSVVVDKAWLSSQPASSFPLVIDPTYAYYTYYHTGVPGGDLGQFIAYKSDGYVCNSSNCDIYVGSLNDRGLKSWRTMMHLPFTDVYGKTVSGASIYTERVNRPYTWSGFEGNRTYWATWANCFGYNCRSGAPQAAGNIDWGGYLDATGLMQWASQNNVGDGWLMMWGNEPDIQSFKSFSGANTFLDVAYYNVAQNRRTDLPTLAAPVNNSKIVVSRPTLKMNPVSDPDGDLVRYSFHLMNSKGNVLAYAGELDAPSWTIPDGILSDGEKYTWRGFVMERNASNPSVIESGWRQTNDTWTFTYTMRTGQDATQTYTDLGAASVNLNTGNLYGSFPTHSISTLGGNLGISLDYNTANLARPGLTAKYYNNTTGSGSPAITVQDPNVDMNWGTMSPYPGVVQADNFRIVWTGYFTAPQDGSYTFGGTRDDNLTAVLQVPGSGNTTVYDATCCGTSWSPNSVTLTKGTAYAITITATEFTGPAYAQLRVRTPDNVERVLPSDWLASSSLPAEGVYARFYKNDDPAANPTYQINEKTTLVYSTVVPNVSGNWGSGSLVPADPVAQYSDNMIVNYSGYLTIPTTGSYQIGANSDDGVRIRLGGQEVYNRTAAGSGYSSSMTFNAGDKVSIQVDYYDVSGTANLSLQWKSPSGNVPVPSQYLTSAPRSVPRGWTISADPDGDIPYEALTVNTDGSVRMIDATGYAHVYTWNEGAKGYKPPVNEDGYLVKNDDNSFTLTDIDGRVYNFSSQGLLTTVTTPTDDKNPAGLRYEYSNVGSTAYTVSPKLSKILDGVDPSRYGQLYYWGESAASSVCSPAPPPYGVPGNSVPPTGALCAFKTFPDNQVTKIQYQNNSLARIERPGGAMTVLSSSASALTFVKDVEDNDAVAAGLANYSIIGTSFAYDALSRVRIATAAPPAGSVNNMTPSLTLPADQSNPTRDYTFEYGLQSTKQHVSGDPEPNGYSKYIEYDNLYRTTKACDNAALCTTTQWDPAKDMELSSTDPLGMKTTTLYDEDDRPTVKYGAAPAAWFATDRTPLPAYAAQVPKAETKYDEGMTGAALAWYGARGQSLFGAPKLHTTGVDAATTNHMGRDFQPAGSVPITTDTTTPGYGFSATGKITFPQSGLYTFRVNHDDGARLYINDTMIVDDWTARTAGAAQSSPEGTFNAEPGKAYRFRLDYIHFDDGTGAGAIDTWLRGPGITDTSGTDLGTNQFGNLISPAYGLITSRTAGDSNLGDTTVKTSYGGDPAYGLIASTAIDPTGLNYTNQATYEALGTGFSRQLSKTLPGGNTTNYVHYGATEAVDNPCTPASDPTSQAGQVKQRVEPDPDGAGPQTSRIVETIYDSSGRPIATRINQDPWTCTTFDARGRVTQVNTPAVMDGATVVRAGRTVTTNYAYGGNPMVTTIQDETGAFTLEERDLHDRVWRQVDANGNTTITLYDNLNRPIKKTSIVGEEATTYNNLGDPISYALDNVTYATMTYDQYGRLKDVQYPQSKDASGNVLKLDQFKYDTLQRSSGMIYKFSDNTTFEETVVRSSSGMVLSNTENLRGVQASSSYTYDKAARLTEATVDNVKYTYDFSAPSSVACSQPQANLNAQKNSNRTVYTVTNLATNQVMNSATYCYDNADRLISSSDNQVGVPTYDDHGNMITLAGNGTPITFTYNNTDQNTAITQGDKKVEYVRTSDDVIIRKKEYENNALAKSYRYADGGRVLQTCSLTDDNACTTVDKYLMLPGGVTLTLSPSNPDSAKQTVYSLKNFHGDTSLTVGANGLPSSSVFLYEPFGQDSPSQTFGTNSKPANSSNETMGWASSPVRKQEGLFSIPIVQMGARTYLPTLGRFAQVDPEEGGTPNAYVYPGDPINSSDYSGNFAFLVPLLILAIRLAPIIIRVVPIIVRVVAAVVAVVKAAAPAINRIQGAATAAKGASAAVNASKVVSSGARVSASGAKASSAAGRVSQGYQGFKSSMQTGQAAHKEFSQIVSNQGGVANRAVFEGSKVRPDGYFPGSRLSLELKPANLRGIAQGEKQLQGYMNLAGGKGQLWLYNQNADGTFNFFLYGVY